MHDRITIRAATIADYDAMTALYAEVDRMSHDMLPAIFPPADRPWRSRELVAGVLADPHARCLVAEADGHVVGLLLARYHESPAAPWFNARRYVEVEDLTVLSTARRTGAGTALMRAAEDWARALGITTVDLQVIEPNDGARRFYERIGYRTRSRRMTREV